MIKEEIKYEERYSIETISVPLPKKEVITYTCSDGTKFNNKEDNNEWGFKGKEKAERYEEKLRIQSEAKKELNFHSIKNGKHKNERYEEEFYFYYHDNLSDLSKKVLEELIFNYNKVNSKLKEEGWYIVKQIIRVNRTGDNEYDYAKKQIFKKLDVYVKSLKDKFLFYDSLALEK